MNGRSEKSLLEHVRALISEVEQIAQKVRVGKMSKVFAEDQAQALVRDITAGLDQMTEAVKRNSISRVDALVVAAQGEAALAAIKKAGFGPSGET